MPRGPPGWRRSPHSAVIAQGFRTLASAVTWHASGDRLTEDESRDISPIPESRSGARLLTDGGIALLVLAVALFGVASLIALLMVANTAPADKQAELRIEAIKYGLGIVASGGAMAALLLAIRRQRLAEASHALAVKTQNHVEIDAAARRVTELYASAVEQLANSQAAIRLGALYALERLAHENPSQRATIVEVLCAYLRMPSIPGDHIALNASAETGKGGVTEELLVRGAAGQILVRHLRPYAFTEAGDRKPNPSFWQDIDLNLSGATLYEWNMASCVVRRATFQRASFHGQTLFTHAKFRQEAQFSGARFSGTADFSYSTFRRLAEFDDIVFMDDVDFQKAIFHDTAWFTGATFHRASFIAASFRTDAWFSGSTFNRSVYFGTNFGGDVEFGECRFTGDVNFRRAVFAGYVDFSHATALARKDRQDYWPEEWILETATDDPSTLRLVMGVAALSNAPPLKQPNDVVKPKPPTARGRWAVP